LNKYNKNIDGTLFNNRFHGSYLITKNKEFNLNNYSFIYHIFLICYTNFNNHYVFDYNKQLIHLYPGGGFTGNLIDLNQINKSVKLISTSPITTKLLEQSNEYDFTEIKTVPMFYKYEKIKIKNLNDGQLIICFSSLGHGTEKGHDKYISIVNEYKSKYPTDNVKFISIGNCEGGHNIINYPPMDYIELQSFYYDSVDIYLNLETGKSFNGWPLGMEAIKSGSVLITTDSSNVSGFYNLQSNPFYITDNLNEYVDVIKSLYIDRNLLLLKSKEGQKFIVEYSSYENQQKKIKEYINKKIA